jgi:hypothetical protein
MCLSDADFKQLIGVTKETYAAMLAELQTAYTEKHRRRGRHAKLPLEDTLFMSLTYWCQYVTQLELAFEFGIGEATAHDWIVWTEDVLVKCGRFSLPGKKALLENAGIEVVLVDVTESRLNALKNSGNGTRAKKKRHHTNQSILRLHRHSETPKKKPKGSALAVGGES